MGKKTAGIVEMMLVMEVDLLTSVDSRRQYLGGENEVFILQRNFPC